MGDPEEEIPGRSIVLPAHPSMIRMRDYDMKRLRLSALRRLTESGGKWTDDEIAYMAAEINQDIEATKSLLQEL
jgi:hypothetical protein